MLSPEEMLTPPEVDQIEFSASIVVTEVRSIRETVDTATTGSLIFDLTVTVRGEPDSDDKHLYRPNDPYGFNPAIREWLVDNPDFPITPYAPPPEPSDEEKRAQMPPLTARQFRLGLVEAGISPSTVSVTIAAMLAGADRDKAQIEWEYATSFNRTHPLIATVGAALGLSDVQIDAMWLAAISL